MPGPNDQLQFSPSGIALLETFEALRLQTYRDIRGIWTIGWGHTGPEVVPTLTWTRMQADTAQQEDVMYASKAVKELVSVKLNQNQFDALVCIVFNIGVNAFKTSTLLHLLNSGDYAGAAEQFGKWIYAGTVISSGLVNRRKAESNLFQTAVN
jgi:lysozyme